MAYVIVGVAQPVKGRAGFQCCSLFPEPSLFHIHTTKSGELGGWALVGTPFWVPLHGSWLRGRGLAVCGSWLLCLSRGVVEEVVAVASGTAGGDDGGASGRPLTKAQPGHRSYNLQERRRIGSMTGAEQALLPRVPTDESEAQTLATADLDLMKSECGAGAEPSVGGNRAKRKGDTGPALPPPQVTGLRTSLGCGGTWSGRMPKGLRRVAGRGASPAPPLGPGPGPLTSPMRYSSPLHVRPSVLSPWPTPLPLGPAVISITRSATMVVTSSTRLISVSWPFSGSWQ